MEEMCPQTIGEEGTVAENVDVADGRDLVARPQDPSCPGRADVSADGRAKHAGLVTDLRRQVTPLPGKLRASPPERWHLEARCGCVRCLQRRWAIATKSGAEPGVPARTVQRVRQRRLRGMARNREGKGRGSRDGKSLRTRESKPGYGIRELACRPRPLLQLSHAASRRPTARKGPGEGVGVRPRWLS